MGNQAEKEWCSDQTKTGSDQTIQGNDFAWGLKHLFLNDTKSTKYKSDGCNIYVFLCNTSFDTKYL